MTHFTPCFHTCRHYTVNWLSFRLFSGPRVAGRILCQVSARLPPGEKIEDIAKEFVIGQSVTLHP